jgi:hypothetical protein
VTVEAPFPLDGRREPGIDKGDEPGAVNHSSSSSSSYSSSSSSSKSSSSRSSSS